eukprot:1112285-Prorocentrum_minimum.AAC.3
MAGKTLRKVEPSPETRQVVGPNPESTDPDTRQYTSEAVSNKLPRLSTLIGLIAYLRFPSGLAVALVCALVVTVLVRALIVAVVVVARVSPADPVDVVWVCSDRPRRVSGRVGGGSDGS